MQNDFNYLKHEGKVTEYDLCRISCKAPKEIGDKLTQISEENSITKNQIVINALKTYFKSYDIRNALAKKAEEDPTFCERIFKEMTAENQQ